MVVPDVSLAPAAVDEPVLRADPLDHLVPAQPGHAPLVLAAVVACCLVAGFLLRPPWRPAAVATAPPALAPPAATAVVRLKSVAPAVAIPVVHALARPTVRPPVRQFARRGGAPRNAHASARVRAPRPAYRHAGRKSGEGRA